MIKPLKKEFARLLFKLFKSNYNDKYFSKLLEGFFYEENTLKQGWNDDLLIFSDFTTIWLEYYFNNKTVIQEKFDKLFVGLDEESKEIAEVIWNRNVKNFPLELKKDWFKFNHKKIFTKSEQEELQELLKLNKTLKLPKGFDEDFCRSVFYNKFGLRYVENTIKDYLRDKTIIDGGAFMGDSAVVFSQYNPCKIYSFEPNSDNFEKLNNIIELNNLTHMVEPVKLGLSDSQKTLYFGSYGPAFNSTRSAQEENAQKIDVTSIDEFMKTREDSVGLIKLDVEGAEYDVIKGSVETIKKQQPVLLISIYHNPHDFFEIKPMLEEILDYTFMIKKATPVTLNTELMLIGYPKCLNS